MTATMPRTAEPDAMEINALLAQLRIARDSVDRKEWLSADLSGGPAASIDEIRSTGSPLSTLDNSGMGFLTPMVSFLDEPLNQLRGDPSPVSSGAGEFDGAARNGTAVADEYRATAGSQTSQWSGKSASDYLGKGTELADGILSIAETALTTAKGLIGAGEAVAKTVADVTLLINEAVGKIVPIMSKAIAEAPMTFGQSIAIAIPECVQIAVECAGKIAGKMAELLSSAENLMKIIDGAVGVVKLVKQVLTFIGKQSQSGGSGTPTTAQQSSNTSNASSNASSNTSSKPSSKTGDRA